MCDLFLLHVFGDIGVTVATTGAAKAGDSLLTSKMLPCLLINLPKPKIHHSSEKRPHRGPTAQVMMRFMHK